MNGLFYAVIILFCFIKLFLQLFTVFNKIDISISYSAFWFCNKIQSDVCTYGNRQVNKKRPFKQKKKYYKNTSCRSSGNYRSNILSEIIFQLNYILSHCGMLPQGRFFRQKLLHLKALQVPAAVRPVRLRTL